jgi:hydroxymethylpyrimidine pyrophosphatase-like HAD family hydrolase
MDPAITPRDLEVIDAATRYVRTELAPQGIIMQPGKAASISLWHPHTPTLMNMRDAIRERCQREAWNLRVSNTVAWINLELAHVSKGSGIDRLCAMMGFQRADLAGIGDTKGDMAIRDRVAWFACPSNAEAELKAKADYTSPHAEVEGVLDVLTHMQPDR